VNHTVTLRARDGHEYGAYIAEPTKGPIAALVAIQEIFGVNRHIRSVADDYAAEGFLVVAPALFDRVGRGIEMDYSPESIARGRELAMQVAGDPALSDISAAIEHARGRVAGKVGVVGYCFGGTVAWLAATRLQPDAAVSYYGGQVARHAEEMPRCPVMLHFGERDAHIPLSDIEAVRRAHPDLAVYTYLAGHGFNCSERSGYDPEAAHLARTRSLDFLRKHLAA
jgi:carboxymethylenebutenolidase